ncbi:MAG TPA: hypothetical protein VLG37_03295 [Candidatus Saccharimonadales bacterium]|nr:hypothetical protein [Candidatus Saccharimonadales bacterium]
MKRSIIRFRILSFLAATVVLVSSSLGFVKPVSALSGSDWRAGRIIDDSIFTSQVSMTPTDIQNFLNSKMPNCDTNGEGTVSYHYNSSTKIIGNPNDPWVTTSRALYSFRAGNPAATAEKPSNVPDADDPWYTTHTHFTCLRDYWETTTGSNPKPNNYGGRPIPSGAHSAALIIWDAAQAYNLSPKVLLVTLQKEKALITDDWPFLSQMQYALGAHCPDSANCDPAYASFTDQMYEGAHLFRYYLDNMQQAWWPYKKPYQVNSVLWNTQSSGCGSGDVYIETKATAALYTYTPYQPNQAALNNLYGTGDGCSAYGNRNFWRMYNDWFGKTIVAGDVWYGWHDISIDNTGDLAEIPIVLTSQPSSNVQVNFKVSDTSRATIVRNGSLFFTPDDYNKMGVHSVFVQGIGGDTSLHNATLTLEVSSVSSSDPIYGNTPLGFYSKQTLYWLNQNERGIHRLYSPSANHHAYASSPADISALTSSGFNDEGVKFYQCTATTDSPLGVNNSNGLVGSLNDPLIFGDSGASPSWMIANGAGSVGTYLFRRSDGNTLVTTSSSAEGASGYSFVAFFKTCRSTDQPVFRFYQPTRGTHFLTTSPSERFSTFINGYNYEGVGFYLASGGTIPVFRLYNPSRGSHFYTVSDSEKTAAQNQGYNYEGVGFYTGP